jgi:hypothetical protein
MPPELTFIVPPVEIESADVLPPDTVTMPPELTVTFSSKPPKTTTSMVPFRTVPPLTVVLIVFVGIVQNP